MRRNKNLINKVTTYLLLEHKRQRWKRTVSALAAIVVFVTTYFLILPAITLDHTSEVLKNEYMYPVSEEPNEEPEFEESESPANDGFAVIDDSVSPPLEPGVQIVEPDPTPGGSETLHSVEIESESESESLTEPPTDTDTSPNAEEDESLTEPPSEDSSPDIEDESLTEPPSEDSSPDIEDESLTEPPSEDSSPGFEDESLTEPPSENVTEIETETGTEQETETSPPTEGESLSVPPLNIYEENGSLILKGNALMPLALEIPANEPFALVIGSSGAAMLAEPFDNGTKLAAQVVTVSQSADGTRHIQVASADDIDRFKAWTFETAEGGYYLTTTYNDGIKKYLSIGEVASNTSANISLTEDQAQAAVITAAEGTDTHAGMIQLQGGGTHINLYGGEAGKGFGGWADDGDNEWFYIITEVDTLSTIDGITPGGTVINLFDYWMTEQHPAEGDWSQGYVDSGINTDHTLKFSGGEGDGNDWNNWTGDKKPPYYGIVKPVLENGYPVLAVGGGESLDYLFDPAKGVTVDGASYKQSYAGVSGLLQINDEGYYYYDSTKNFAELDEDTDAITLYSNGGVYSNKGVLGQFFPFNDYSNNSQIKSTHSSLNHHFGLTLTSRFIQQYSGHTDITKTIPMEFEFAGDDDVWIFVDDVLVADIGGIHDAASAKINFATGSVDINYDRPIETSHTTLYECFETAGKTDSVDWITVNGNQIFSNNTYHTLKLFYLERGNYDSNLHLKYNLTSFPSNGLVKVDQFGNSVKDAAFAVYPADENFNLLTALGGELADLSEGFSYDPDSGDIVDSSGNVIVPALYYGTTNTNGEMIFVGQDQMPYTIPELETLFGTNFILKEVKAPPGYRMVDALTHLRIYNSRIIICENTKDSAVYSSANLQVTAPGMIKPINGDPINYYGGSNINGTLFAVIMKYVGKKDENGDAPLEQLAKNTNWKPVYGDSNTGYITIDVAQDYNGDYVAAAIETAKRYADQSSVFRLAPSGSMTGTLDEMPGNVQTYYSMIPAGGNKGQTAYTVAYYYSSADSLDGATTDNTYRIDADAEGYEFGRFFGSTIAVPNLINQVMVQKRDENLNLINGATFAMYEVEEHGGTIYYVADDGTLIRIDKDEDADNEGIAYFQNGNSGTYVIDGNTGVITVRTANRTYLISPENDANSTPLVKTTASVGEGASAEDGTADFQYVLENKYIIREIKAPPGYAVNPVEVMALVTSNAIYINAGTADDGLSVMRGPGYIVSNMKDYASIGDIDNTLSWIYTHLKISHESTSFSDVSPDKYYDPASWNYVNKNRAKNWDTDTVSKNTEPYTVYLEYNAESVSSFYNYTRMDKDLILGFIRDGHEGTEQLSQNYDAATRRIVTDIGWSYLDIYQTYPYGFIASSTANYDDWWTTDTPGVYDDISHMFARAVYAVVSDKPASNLEIVKKVENGDESSENAEFSFKVELFGEDKKPLTETYYYKVYNIVPNGDRTLVPAPGGISRTIRHGQTITLRNDQVAVISNLPKGRNYSVTENYDWAYKIHAVKDKGEGDEASFDAVDSSLTVEGLLDWNLSGGMIDNLSTVEFTNTLIPDINVSKIASDTQNPLSGAVFILYRTKEINGAQTTLYYTENGWVANRENAAKLATDKKGIVTFKHIFDGTFTLEEVMAPIGYLPISAPIQITVANGEITSVDAGTDTYETSEDKSTLIVPNDVNPKIPETGGEGSPPYYIGLLLIFSAVCLYKIRRRLERRSNRAS